jgi:DNA-binding GntR family transcriptional regulator
MALESVVARRVAALPEDVRAGVAERMSARNREFRAVGERAPLDVSGILEADHAVHGAYIEAAAGARLVALRAAVKPQLDRYTFNYGASVASFVPEAAAEHEAIASAIVAGDVDGSGAAVIRNWENAATRLQNAIAAAGERGDW